MYTRSNSYAEAPGRWITGDGEYEFLKAGKTWKCRHRAHWNAAQHSFETRTIGETSTLAAAFALAARHYVHPVVPVDLWPYPAYQCSGDLPGDHVDCAFATDSYAEANTHFERTGHNVDERAS